MDHQAIITKIVNGKLVMLGSPFILLACILKLISNSMVFFVKNAIIDGSKYS